MAIPKYLVVSSAFAVVFVAAKLVSQGLAELGELEVVGGCGCKLSGGGRYCIGWCNCDPRLQRVYYFCWSAPFGLIGIPYILLLVEELVHLGIYCPHPFIVLSVLVGP